MSIKGSMKWLALAAAGVLVSGCVAAPNAYSPSTAGYTDTPPGTFVADPNYPGGGYYEVLEVYDDSAYYGGDPYYYSSAPYYGCLLYTSPSPRDRG